MPIEAGVITSYQTLIDAITAELLRGDVTADASRWIRSTELELFRDCDVRPGDQFQDGSLAALDASVALPTGAIEVKRFVVADNAGDNLTCKLVSQDKFAELRSLDQSGVPKAWQQFRDFVEFAPATSAIRTYSLWYYGMPEPLSESNPTNQLLEIGSDAYLYGALMHSALGLGHDERYATWKDIYTGKKNSLKAAYWRSRVGGPLETLPDFTPRDGHYQR